MRKNFILVSKLFYDLATELREVSGYTRCDEVAIDNHRSILIQTPAYSTWRVESRQDGMDRGTLSKTFTNGLQIILLM